LEAEMSFRIPLCSVLLFGAAHGLDGQTALDLEPPPPKVEPVKVSATVSVRVPEEMRKGSVGFLEKRMGLWKIEDAKSVLGEPTRQRDSLAGTKVDGVIYAFTDPTAAMREFELSFSNITSRLRAVYAYPYKATLKEAQALWGRKYRDVKNANGTHSYMYRDRQLIVFTDSNGGVISLGVYLP